VKGGRKSNTFVGVKLWKKLEKQIIILAKKKKKRGGREKKAEKGGFETERWV